MMNPFMFMFTAVALLREFHDVRILLGRTGNLDESDLKWFQIRCLFLRTVLANAEDVM